MLAFNIAKIRRSIRAVMFGLGFVSIGINGTTCAPEQESVVVLGMPILSEDCGASSGGSVFLAGMRVDLSFDTGLLIPLEIYNQIENAPAGTQNSGINPAEVQLDSVDVELSTPQAPEVIDALFAAHPNHVSFNLPLPTDSISGLARKVVFIQVPEHTLARLGDVMRTIGYGDGSEILVNFEFRFYFRRAGTAYEDFGLISARPFTVPVHTGVNNLRYCRPTLYQYERGDETVAVDLCTEANCLEDREPGLGSRCGNAQQLSIAPVCCMGTEEFDSQQRSPRECGFE